MSEAGKLCAPHEFEAKGIGTVTHCFCKDCPMRDEIILKPSHGFERWALALAEEAADEATFQIARTVNRSRADSRPARMRWWRVYAAFPEIYREAAAKVWQSQVIDARKRA